MHEIDVLLRDRRVMHRAEVASISSRATLKRRVDEGQWWRPTYRTVAPTELDVDDSFWFETALAHTWPDGALTGEAMLFVLGRQPSPPNEIRLSIPRSSRSTHDGRLRLHVVSDQRHSTRWLAGRPLRVDLGATSVLLTALAADPETASWLAIDAVNVPQVVSLQRRLENGGPLLAKLRALDRPGTSGLTDVVGAAIAGCQSPGEIEVWKILTSLRVEFEVQKRWLVPTRDRTLVRSRSIYSDFWIPSLRAVLEVDSQLHDHLSDVRRDTWLRRRRVRTLRFVGRDFFTAPDDFRHDIASGLVSLGWRPGLA
jgi:hypothetical protein